MHIKHYRRINHIESESGGGSTESDENTEHEDSVSGEEQQANALMERIDALVEQSNAILETVASLAASMSAFVEAGAVITESTTGGDTEPDTGTEVAEGVTAEDAETAIEDMDFTISEKDED